MQEVGETLHIAKSGRLIVRLRTKVEPGSILLDKKGRKVGRVVELIGPVSSPYATAVLLSDSAGKEGQEIFQ